MSDPNWFQKKWGMPEVPTDILFKKIEELQQRVSLLEEENTEKSNLINQLMHSIEAVDGRIDIIVEYNGTQKDV